MTIHDPAPDDETPRPDAPPDTPGAGAEGQTWEGPMHALGRTVARAIRHMDHVDNRVSELAAVITDLATKLTTTDHSAPADANPAVAGGPDGVAGPGVRSWLLADDVAQAAADLDDLAAWIWRVYLWWPDAQLSSCWLWHPEIVEELWALRVAHADAYDPQTGSSMRVSDWLDRHRPSTARRVRGVLVKCELTRHIPFNNRPVEVVPPGPPALASHAGEVAAVWTAGAGLDAVRAAGPEPTPAQIAEADAYQRALYRSGR